MTSLRRFLPVAGVEPGASPLPHLLLGACLPLTAAALLGVLGLFGAAPLPVPPPEWTALTTATALVCALAATFLLHRRPPEAPGTSEVSAGPHEGQARVVAHELRSSLVLPLAHLDTALTRGRAADQVREDIERAASALGRTDALVGHLLLETSSRSTARDTVDLHALTVAALTDFAPLARRRGLAVSMSSEEPACTIAGDARALRQLLDNLLSNAVKYAEVDSWIDVALSSTADTVHLTVTNAGTSADGQEDETLFDPAQRGSRAAERAEGHGVGLAVVRSVARLHGGDATLHSDDVTGTTQATVDVARFHPQFHPALPANE